MQYDLGSTGQIIVGFFAIGFGAMAQIVAGRRSLPWVWIAGALGWLVGAIFASEVMFATATVDEIQPIIDGLAFDEALLGGLIGGLVASIAVWALTRWGEEHEASAA